jgi:hypothetical protein
MKKWKLSDLYSPTALTAFLLLVVFPLSLSPFRLGLVGKYLTCCAGVSAGS